MNIADIKKQATDKMAKSVETLRVNLTHVRTGRAHVGMLDAIKVDYYGSDVPINVFSIFKEGAVRRVVMGEDEGTLVHN